MFFSRRSIQASLDTVRSRLGDALADDLAAKLNRADKQRLPTVWETAYLSTLSGLGTVEHEKELPSRKRPDIHFTAGPGQTFVADITAASDKGVDEQNPIQELYMALQGSLKRLKIPEKSIHVEAKGDRSKSKKGERTFLKLPDRRRIPEVLRKEIEPKLREQIKSGAKVLFLAVATETEEYEIRIDDDRYSSMSHPAFDLPTSIDDNPLFRALKGKAEQLRGAEGLTGIIACDADCTAMKSRAASFRGHTRTDIARDVLRQFSRLDFVLLTTVEQVGRRPHDYNHRIDAELVTLPGRAVPPWLEEVLRSAVRALPKPRWTPVNARHRAQTPIENLGFHGGYSMSGDDLKVSSRMILEVLAGRMTVDEMNVICGWPVNPFERSLNEGRLLRSADITRSDDDDDLIEIKFGRSDPAIAPFS